MSIWESVISGLVQGLTEFLPVSSSGHLVLLHKLFGYSEPSVFFDICLHVGTLLSVLVFFGAYIISLVRQKEIKLLLYLAVATVPAVAAALIFGDSIEGAFSDPKKVSFFLIVTGLILFAAQVCQVKRSKDDEKAGLRSSIFMGIAQAFALFPGISRSGATISMGLFSGLKEEDAFRFSFLMSVPAILGALLFKLLSFESSDIAGVDIVSYSAGVATAFVAGIVSLFFLWKAIKVKRIYIFGIYCVVVGAAGIFYW